MLRLRSQRACPRLSGTCLAQCEQLPSRLIPRPLPASSFSTFATPSPAPTASCSLLRPQARRELFRAPVTTQGVLLQCRSVQTTKKHHKKTPELDSKAKEREANAARIRKELPSIDIASVYNQAKDILLGGGSEAAKPADGEAAAGGAAVEGEGAAGDTDAPPPATASKALLRKLREHLSILEEFLKVEEESERTQQRLSRRKAARAAKAAKAAETTEAAAGVADAAADAAPDAAADPSSALETAQTDGATPQQQQPAEETTTSKQTIPAATAPADAQKKQITWQDVYNLKSALHQLHVARHAELLSKKKAQENTQAEDSGILSIAHNVLKEQKISLKKSNRPDKSEGRSGGGKSEHGASSSSSSGDKGDKGGKGSSRKKRGVATEEADTDPAKTHRFASQDVKSIRSKDIKLVAVDVNETRTPPPLSYKLDRVLFNQGVYQLQDLRSKVYNFDPYLACIMPIAEFDYNALKGYTTSSKDNKLINIAAEHGRQFCGSTSSMSSVLAHFHYLLSDWRPLGFGRLSKNFTPDSPNFTEITRSPAATFLRWRDGVYAIDADKEFDTATILSMLGRSMEKLLTLPQDDYEKYRRSRSSELTDEERNADEVYHYSTLGDFMIRSQLDAYDPRLPGAGVFDLKTRAVVTVRMDAQRFEDRRHYEIKGRHGEYESFEREYYDLIRSAFLKYSLQVRMGRMDGIFLAYHNTQRIFGFQYVPLEEMDEAMHGTSNRLVGDAEFRLSLKLWNEVLDKIMEKFRGRSVRMHVETRPGPDSFMYVFAKPVTEEEVSAIQDANAKAVAEMENNILGITREESMEEMEVEGEGEGEGVEAGEAGGAGEAAETADTAATETTTPETPTTEAASTETTTATTTTSSSPEAEDVWDAITQRVEESMENEELGVEHVRESIRTALEHSGLMGGLEEANVERYVDSLLGILIRDEAGPKEEEGEEAEAEVEAQEESVVSEAEAEAEVQEGQEVVVEAEAEAEVQEVAAEQTEQPELVEPAEAQEESSVKAGADAQESSIEAEAEVDAQEESPVESEADAQESTVSEVEVDDTHKDTLSPGVSLKDLLLQQVKAQESNTAEATDERLANFGRILSELVASSPPKEPADAKSADHHDDSAWHKVDEAIEADAANNELMGMAITVRSKVNGEYVKRVELDATAHELNWELEYTIKDMDARRAQALYRGLLDRRRKALVDEEKQTTARSARFSERFQRKMDDLSNQGKKFRRHEDAKNRKKPVYVVGEKKPRSWQSVFGGVKEWGGAKEKGGE